MLKPKRKLQDASLSNEQAATIALEEARKCHEKYLIRAHVGDFNDAVNHYISAIKLNPNLSQTYYRLASLMWESGEISLDTAIENCRKAVELSPKNSNAHLYFGFFLKLSKNYEGAEKEIKSAIDVNPLKAGRARMVMAMFLLEKMAENKLNISEFIKSVYYLFSGTLMMFWDKGSIKMMYENFYDKCSTLFFKSIGKVLEGTRNYSLAIKTYDIAAENTGRDEIFLNKIGDISIKKECPHIAVDAYRKVLAARPDDRDTLVKLATVIQTYFNDNLAEAIDCYNKLLVIEPGNAQIYYELGHLYLKKNEKMNACNAFKLALSKDENNPFYHNSFAYSLIQLEQYEEAIEHYQTAINLNPDNKWTAIVCQALGSIYAQILENYEAALELFRMATVLDPESSNAYINIGDVYFDKGELDNAIKNYLEAIKLNDQDARAFGKCAIALWENDYVEESIVAYSKAIALDDEYELAYNNLGVAYLDGIGNAKEAARNFSRAVEINPNYTLAHFNLGRSYQMLGDNQKAIKSYQMALNLNSVTHDIDEEDLQQRIHKLFEV